MTSREVNFDQNKVEALSETTPYGADGREQVALTAFLGPRGAGERRSPPWPAVGLLRSLLVTETDQHSAT